MCRRLREQARSHRKAASVLPPELASSEVFEMNVLIIGSGGREHALAWKVAQDPRVQKVFVAPGNAGTAIEAKCENVAIDVLALEQLADFAEKNVSLTIVGPEVPLVAGVVDLFRARGLDCFGPTAGAAQLEGSKAFTKDFLARHKIPTADYQNFTEIEPASGCIQYHETVTATGRTTRARCCRTGCGRFKCSRRVGAGSDGLLQFFNRWRGLCSGFCQVGGGVRISDTPLSVAAQVQGAAIGQFERDGASGTGVYLIADKQPVAFNEYAVDALWGHRENLTNNAFDDGNNTAH